MSDTKISDMTGATTLNSEDLHTIVQGGTNKKITHSDMVAQLGVTGTIVQDGAVTGIAILDTQGSVNNIRNFEAGAGIQASVSAENGLSVSNNFQTDTTGTQLVDDLTAVSPKLSSLVAGDGIEITKASDAVTIKSSAVATYATTSMHDNTTATVIAATGTPVKVAGTFVAGDASGFTVDTTGRITCTQSGTTRHVANVLITVDVASGTNHSISVLIAKNGTVVASTEMADVISAGLPRCIVTFLNTTLENGDYLEIFVQNDSTTDNLTVKHAILGVL